MSPRATVGSAIIGVALAACTPGDGALSTTTAILAAPSFLAGDPPPRLGDVDLNPGWEMLPGAVDDDRVLVATETGIDIYDFGTGGWVSVPPATNNGAALDRSALWDGTRVLSFSPGAGPDPGGFPATFLAFTPPPGDG